MERLQYMHNLCRTTQAGTQAGTQAVDTLHESRIAHSMILLDVTLPATWVSFQESSGRKMILTGSTLLEQPDEEESHVESLRVTG